MEFYFTNEEVDFLSYCAENIQKIIGRAIGREENFKARRDTFRVLDFQTALKEKNSAERDPAESFNHDCGILHFTEKEIAKMPTRFRKLFRTSDGVVAHVRRKKNGVFEIRCMINGTRYTGSSTSLKKAKERFILSLKKAQEDSIQPTSTFRAMTVGEYTLHYIETFKKPLIGEKTFKNYVNLTKKHILPYFGETKITDLTATQCQSLLSILWNAEKHRTAEEINNILSWISSAAIADKLIQSNPMAIAQIPKHHRESGKQIPVSIMHEYLSAKPTAKSDLCIWLIAYTGIRPIEIKSLTISNGFFIIKNAKIRKNEKQTYRKIPIHRELLEKLKQIKECLELNTHHLSRFFKKRFPQEYRLYDLRHTFTSRALECGISKPWIDYITAHTTGENTTTKIYTHFSDEFHISEMSKLNYSPQLVPKEDNN